MEGKRKYIVLLVIILLFLFGWTLDSIRAGEFSIEVISVTPEIGIADGQTPVTVQLRVTHNGQPCEDHILFGQSMNGGSFRAKRVATDENGIAAFVYFPYYKTELVELIDVALHFEDESNSLLIVVPAELDLVLPMKAPDNSQSGGKTNDDMFG